MEHVRNGGIPVPGVFCCDRSNKYFDRPFVVMEKVNGETLGDLFRRKQSGDPYWRKSDEVDRWLDRFAALLASIHQMDWNGVGLDFVTRIPGSSKGKLLS